MDFYRLRLVLLPVRIKRHCHPGLALSLSKLLVYTLFHRYYFVVLPRILQSTMLLRFHVALLAQLIWLLYPHAAQAQFVQDYEIDTTRSNSYF